MRKNWIEQAAALAVLIALLAVLPAGAQEPPWKPSRHQGTFLLMSDIHFDPYADPSLVKKLKASPVEDWESIFQSSTLKGFSPYGKDTNYPLFQSALQEAAARGRYDYAIVTGDFISHHFKESFKTLTHGDDKAYQSFVLKTVEYVTRSIRKAIGDAPAYFCLGNNDSDYNDYGGLFPGSPFLPSLAKDWPTVAQDPQAVEDFSQGGYCVLPHPTLKGHEIVILNDVFWSYKYDPFWAFKKGGKFGPNGPQEEAELKWLQKTLADARARNLKVSIVTHIPPGVNGRNASEHQDRTKPQKTFYGKNYLWPFLNELATYRDVVDGEFNGHTHMDDFRVIRDRGGKPVFFSHLCPAVSPVRNNNPGFQVMLYDKKTGRLRDMATYYAPLPEKPGDADPTWKLEYDFDQAYGCKAYDFGSLLALANAIETDAAVREKYIHYVPVSSTHDPPATLEDWSFFACALMNLDPESYKQCYLNGSGAVAGDPHYDGKMDP